MDEYFCVFAWGFLPPAEMKLNNIMQFIMALTLYINGR
jgi:hypothetical protein